MSRTRSPPFPVADTEWVPSEAVYATPNWLSLTVTVPREGSWTASTIRSLPPEDCEKTISLPFRRLISRWDTLSADPKFGWQQIST